MSRTPETGTTREVAPVRLDPAERKAIESVQRELGEETLSSTIRSLPRVWSERQLLLRAALEPHRGRFSREELRAVLDAMNGAMLLHDVDGRFVGMHLAPNVADTPGLGERHGIDQDALVRRLSDLPVAARAALELWTCDLWRRYQDDELWEREVAWLANAPKVHR